MRPAGAGLALGAVSILAAAALAGTASAQAALTAGVPAGQKAPSPARLADGKPNWTGFWTPVGGMMDRSFGPRPAGEAPAPRPAPAAQANAGAGGGGGNNGTVGAATSPLKSPYKEKYDQLRKDAAAGKVAFDPAALCLPPGMPRMMGMIYGMEFLQVPGQVTITGEWQAAQRRIWLDGRKPPNPEEALPTFAGYSVGRWEGDVLVVETTQVRDDVLIDQSGLPLTEKTVITERFWSPQPGVLVDEITIDDPQVYTAPWKQLRRYRFRPELNLQEYVCAENNRNVGPNGEPTF